MSLWASLRECTIQALDPAYWCSRIDAWIMGNHLPPYDWVVPPSGRVACRLCWKDWPCEIFMHAEERQNQRTR